MGSGAHNPMFIANRDLVTWGSALFPDCAHFPEQQWALPISVRCARVEMQGMDQVAGVGVAEGLRGRWFFSSRTLRPAGYLRNYRFRAIHLRGAAVLHHYA